MRLFVGITIDAVVARRIVTLIETLRARVASQAPGARIAWTPAERLHLTVQFIGHVGADRADAIKAVLEPPLAIAPFDISVGGLGVFPGRGAPRVVWMGVTEHTGRLAALVDAVGARLRQAQVTPEDRAYRPHLTLARVREAQGLRAGAVLAAVDAPAPGSSPVDAITLFESRLSPHGPAYVPVQRTPLQ